VPNELAQQFIDAAPTPFVAACEFMSSLMAGDPATFKVGYSADNAYLATRECFDDALDNDQWRAIAELHHVSHRTREMA